MTTLRPSVAPRKQHAEHQRPHETEKGGGGDHFALQVTFTIQPAPSRTDFILPATKAANNSAFSLFRKYRVFIMFRLSDRNYGMSSLFWQKFTKMQTDADGCRRIPLRG